MDPSHPTSLTSNIEDIISTFLTSLLNQPSIPPSAILISKLGLASGSLGLLCPRTRAAPDFVITMTTPTRNAKHCFCLHQDLLPFNLHQSLCDLFTPSVNTTSQILQQYQHLLPKLTYVACAPSTPTTERTTFPLIHLRKECLQLHQTTLQQLSLDGAPSRKLQHCPQTSPLPTKPTITSNILPPHLPLPQPTVAPTTTLDIYSRLQTHTLPPTL